MSSTHLPIWLIEPVIRRDLVAQKLAQVKLGATPVPENSSVDEICQQLRKIREFTQHNIDSLVKELRHNLSQEHPQVAVTSVSDSIEAVKYIAKISGDINLISTNNSSVISQELKPGLVASGFTVLNSYYNEFDIKEGKFLDYWALPRLLDENIIGSFEVSAKMSGIDQPCVTNEEIKACVAVLGVNAISAQDTTVYFLQHFSNIYNDLRYAKKVILVVGLDKIVRSKSDATFQTKCMGIFGMESLLLEIQPKATKTLTIADLKPISSNGDRELHIIILDNGRTNLLQGKFRDLFLCIGCRACNKHCPIRHTLGNADYIWTPKNYLYQVINGNISTIDACLHCEACRIECPVDIDLPYLIWQAKIDYINKHGRPFRHKILGRHELLAKLGTATAPVSNWVMGLKPARALMELVTGIDRRANLPKFQARTFGRRFKKNV